MMSKTGLYDPILESGENGPIIVIIPFLSPEEILRNIIFVDHFFYKLVFYMMENRIFRWNRNHIKPLFGSIKSSLGSKKVAPYMCETLTLKLVKLLKLRRIPSPSFGDFDLVAYGAKRGFPSLVQHAVEELASSKIKRKPADNTIEIAIEQFTKDRMSILNLKKMLHTLLKHFPDAFRLGDTFFSVVINHLDLKTFQLMYTGQNESKLDHAFIGTKFISRLLKVKCQTKVDEELRLEIFKILVRNHSKEPLKLEYVSKFPAGQIDEELYRFLLSQRIPVGRLDQYRMSRFKANNIIDNLLRRKHFPLLDDILKIQMSRKDDTTQQDPISLYHTLGFPTSLIIYILKFRNDEKKVKLLESYLDLIKRYGGENVFHRNYYEDKNKNRKFYLRIERFFDIKTKEEEEEKISTEELSSKYFEQIRMLIDSGYFVVSGKTIEKVMYCDKKLLDLLLKHISTSYYTVRTILRLFLNANDTENVKKILEYYGNLDFKHVEEVIVNQKNNEALFHYFSTFQDLEDDEHIKNQDGGLYHIIRKSLEKAMYCGNKQVSDFLLRLCMKNNVKVLDTRLFQYAFSVIFKLNYGSGMDRKYHNEFLRRIVTPSETKEDDYRTLISSKTNRAYVIQLSLHQYFQQSSLKRHKKNMKKKNEEEEEVEGEEDEDTNDESKIHNLYFNRLSSNIETNESIGGYHEVTSGILCDCLDGFIPWKMYTHFVSLYRPTTLNGFKKLLNGGGKQVMYDYVKKMRCRYLSHLIMSLQKRKLWRDFYILMIQSSKLRKEVIGSQCEETLIIKCSKCSKDMNVLENDVHFFCFKCSLPSLFCETGGNRYSENQKSGRIPKVCPRVFCGECVMETSRFVPDRDRKSGRVRKNRVRVKCYVCKNENCLENVKIVRRDEKWSDEQDERGKDSWDNYKYLYKRCK